MSLINAPSLGIRSDIGLNYDKLLFNLNQQQFGVRYNYQRFNYAKATNTRCRVLKMNSDAFQVSECWQGTFEYIRGSKLVQNFSVTYYAQLFKLLSVWWTKEHTSKNTTRQNPDRQSCLPRKFYMNASRHIGLFSLRFFLSVCSAIISKLRIIQQ